MDAYTDQELLTNSWALIQKERIRQVVRKRYTPDHDDLHAESELAWAAIAYALPAETPDREFAGIDPLNLDPNDFYPWGDIPNSLEDANPIRKLVIAGALIAAEIERLQRKVQREMTTEAAGKGCA